MTITSTRLKRLYRYDPETGFFTRLVRGKKKVGTLSKDGYLAIQIDGNLYYAHRLVWLYVTGEWPSDQIDHINRKKDDNRWCNLRGANGSQNRANAPALNTNSCGLKGVWFAGDHRRKPWRAKIVIGGKKIHLGYFSTKELAHEAYFSAACAHFGEFARAA